MESATLDVDIDHEALTHRLCLPLQSPPPIPCANRSSEYTAATSHQRFSSEQLHRPLRSQRSSQASTSTVMVEQSSGDFEQRNRQEGERILELDHNGIDATSANWKRVILRTGGIKCSCVNNDLSQHIRRIPDLRKHKFNHVLGKLEFEVDLNRMPLTNAIENLGTRTGFTFEEMADSTGQILDILTKAPESLKLGQRLYGIIKIETLQEKLWQQADIEVGFRAILLNQFVQRIRLRRQRMSLVQNKDVTSPTKPGLMSDLARLLGPSLQANQHYIRVHHDAKIIGPRTIFQHYETMDPNIRLKTPRADMSVVMVVRETKWALAVFFISLVLTIPVLALTWSSNNHPRQTYVHVSFLFATFIQIIATKEFGMSALKAFHRSRAFDGDFLPALSTTCAYVFSVVCYVFQVRGSPIYTRSFFETSTLLTTTILLGRLLHVYARLEAVKSVSYRSLQAQDALLVDPTTRIPAEITTTKIDTRLLQCGDIFKVPPHAQVATDGLILYGGSEIDESMITGESTPVAKGVHSQVYAGTTNGSGDLIVQVTALPHKNSIQKIATMIEAAKMTQPKAQVLANRIVGYCLPTIIAVSYAVLLIWVFVSRQSHKMPLKGAVVQAIQYAIATMAVACPCAVGLAVPMVVTFASAAAARFGIIVGDPQKLEVARKVTDVVFDKTGTLTCGTPKVIGVDFHDGRESESRSIIMGLLQGNRHPVATAVYTYLERQSLAHPKQGSKPALIINIVNTLGCGVSGTCLSSGAFVRAGNPDWLCVPTRHRSDSSTVLCVTINGNLSATFHLHDRPRHTAELVLTHLTQRGITAHLLSGDSQCAVNTTAHSLSIAKRHTRARCTPSSKASYIRAIQSKDRVVLFVGDGIDDALALEQADIGVHMAHTSDIVRDAADVVFMTPRLHDILLLLDVSAATHRRIVFNFVWCAVYHVLAILLAAGALTPVAAWLRIAPMWAGFGEVVSLLPILGAAFSLRARGYGKRYRGLEWDYLRGVEGERRGRARRRTGGTTVSDGGCGGMC